MRRATMLLSGLLCLGMATFLSAASVILNEYNAVGSASLLGGGQGSDGYFGQIYGNGGNWFELLVIDDVDMRGWQLEWREDELNNRGETSAGVLTLSDTDFWSTINRGSILTFIESADAGSQLKDTRTDTSFDSAAGDWWINICTREEARRGEAALVTTVTNHGGPGDFGVGNDFWELTIRDRRGNIVFGPAGEGASVWPSKGVSNEEGAALGNLSESDGSPVTLETWQAVTPASPFYTDINSTSFGRPNDQFSPPQDLSALRGGASPVTPLSGDLDNDGQLTAADIDLLSTDARANTNNLLYDLNNDQLVNHDDRVAWVHSLRNTYFGDANLDGEFNSADLVVMLASGAYENDLNAGWADGDFNGDGRTTSADLVTALSDGGYETGPRRAVAAVPEPCAIWLLGWGGMGWAMGMGRRGRRVNVGAEHQGLGARRAQRAPGKSFAR